MSVASKQMPEYVGQVLDIDGDMVLVLWNHGIKQWCHMAFLQFV